MVQETRVKKIVEHLFYNPFSSVAFISAACGLAAHSVRRALAATAGVLRSRIPTLQKPYYVIGHMPDEHTQLQYMGRSRSPLDLCQAALMMAQRLNIVRSQILPALMRQGQVLWTISPWYIPRSETWLDALLCLKAGRGRGCLVGICLGNVKPGYAYYTGLAEAWSGWQGNREQAVPAVLSIWDELLPAYARRAVQSGSAAGQKRLAFCSSREQPGIAYQKILGQGAAADLDLLQRGYFVPGCRKSLRMGARKGLSALLWAQQHLTAPAARAAGCLEQLDASQVTLLQSIARHPALSAPELADTLAVSARDGVPAAIERLQEFSFITSLQVGDQGVQLWISPLGLQFLAGVLGVSSALANRYLGYPLMGGKPLNQVRHLGEAAAFMSRLARQGALVSWSTNYLCFRYKLADGRKISIVPDGAGYLKSGDELTYFWLELDRGTRRGRDIRWKVQKYFLAGQARTGDRPLPLLLYLVSDPRGYNRARSAYIQRLIADLALPDRAEPRIAVSSVDLLPLKTPDLLGVQAWQLFEQGKISDKPCSLHEIVSRNAGHRQGSGARA